MKLRRSTIELLQDLANLDISKEVYVVHNKYLFFKTQVKCPYCEGKGSYIDDDKSIRCEICRGEGTMFKGKRSYIVENIGCKYPDIIILHNTIEGYKYEYIQGFFNDKEKAQKLANELNKE